MVELRPTADVLAALGKCKRSGQVLVGFAAETADVRANASEKLRSKNADLLVANDVGAEGVGFEHDTNEVLILFADGDGTTHTPDRQAGGGRCRSRRRPRHPFGRDGRQPPRRPDMTNWTFTSESVTEGHPDKMADQISDSILDAILEQDPMSRVACETMVTTGLCIVAGEITTSAYVDIPTIARKTICDIGYDRESFGYDGNTCGVMVAIDEQSPDIAQGVDDSEEVRSGTAGEEDQLDKQGAGDQGMMFGYAVDETDVLMPLPDPPGAPPGRAPRPRSARPAPIPYLRPDAKTQVTFEYEDNRPVALKTVLISTQHNDGVDRDSEIRPDLIEQVIRPTIPEQFADDHYEVFVNPTGRFVIGGPVGDCGLTGRKIIVDTYGGAARHGGGAFSGKDPSKVDRSAAYAARWVAKNVVASGAATRCEVQVAYAIGMARPGVGPRRDVRHLHRRPGQARARGQGRSSTSAPAPSCATSTCASRCSAKTAAYGHFGREGFSWEDTDRVADLKSALGL